MLLIQIRLVKLFQKYNLFFSVRQLHTEPTNEVCPRGCGRVFKNTVSLEGHMRTQVCIKNKTFQQFWTFSWNQITLGIGPKAEKTFYHGTEMAEHKNYIHHGPLHSSGKAPEHFSALSSSTFFGALIFNISALSSRRSDTADCAGRLYVHLW